LKYASIAEYTRERQPAKAAEWRPHPAKVGEMFGGDVAARKGCGEMRGGKKGRVISRVVKSTRVKNNPAIAIPFTA
jgi:hypothetical protein